MSFQFITNKITGCFDDDGDVLVTFKVHDIGLVIRMLDELKEGKEYLIEVKQKYNRRSEEANRYAWKLTSLLAEKVNIDTRRCHEILLARYGQPEKDAEGNLIHLNLPASFDYRQSKVFEGMYLEPIYAFYQNEILMNEYRVLKGSKYYNSQEMNRFIDGIIDDCKEQGIETLPPDEVEKLKHSWKMYAEKG